ncbi:hypothetical protein ACIPY6_25295 [Streptomyces sp. NPDC090054]|uniref:hypothetical protein n=1 Tax=Streptomyces sp. NPDC090054 TaxID=3365933 RepID=UPI003827E15A
MLILGEVGQTGRYAQFPQSGERVEAAQVGDHHLDPVPRAGEAGWRLTAEAGWRPARGHRPRPQLVDRLAAHLGAPASSPGPDRPRPDLPATRQPQARAHDPRPPATPRRSRRHRPGVRHPGDAGSACPPRPGRTSRTS